MSSHSAQPPEMDPYYACSRRVVVDDDNNEPILLLRGLFTFSVAATILRLARGDCDVSVIDGDGERILHDFFDRLLVALECDIEESTRTHQSHASSAPTAKSSIIVVVEGLDGSGKSTLVEQLAAQHHCVRWSTPTQTLSDARPVFDKLGGAVARAFYMVSNYLLQYEIRQFDEQQQTDAAMTVHVVDRWVTSTIAYSLAWNFPNIDALPGAAFDWPHDVRPPDLLLILKIEDTVRRERVKLRHACSRHNPWDDRLDQDVALGQRIVRSFERVGENLQRDRSSGVAYLNANASPHDVLQQAMHEIESTKQQALQHSPRAPSLLQRHHQHSDPTRDTSPFHRDPLSLFRRVSSDLNLCDAMTGQRHKHALWNLQVAWNHTAATITKSPLAPPLLKTVGIHTVDSTGILFHTRHTPTPSPAAASVVWCGGEYPYEQQWRAEGFLLPMGANEQPPPPPSLVAYVAACCAAEQHHARFLRTDEERNRLVEAATQFRACPPLDGNTLVQGTRFVPLRMEVLMGGPSSPGGPRRYEWTRGMNGRASSEGSPPQHGDDNDEYDDVTGWSKARLILPFGPASPGTSSATAISQRGLCDVTVALTGTHCSGKATLGRAVADMLGWPFHGELGDSLRDPSEVSIPAGYKVGYSSGSHSWDDRIFLNEVHRDQQQDSDSQSSNCRVVETWHVGNICWAKIRLDTTEQSKDDSNARQDKMSLEDRYERAKGAIEEDQTVRRRHVLAIHVAICPEDTVRRRQRDIGNRDRLPIDAKQEVDECNLMHQALDVCAQTYWKRLQQELANCSIPMMVLDNSDDGANAIDTAVRKIVTFINEQQWRRAFTPS